MRLLSGRRGWVVLRYAEGRQLLTDRRISKDLARPDFPALVPAPVDDGSESIFQDGEFISMDPPQHTFYRRMLISEFSVRRVDQMRPRILGIVDSTIDTMLSGKPAGDLVEKFGLPVPSMVVCQLLGVPYADHGLFNELTWRMARITTDVAEGTAAIAELREYLEGLVTRSEREPGDDLIGRLVRSRRATGELSHEALTGMVALLLFAGYETVANMIPLGVLTLLRQPATLAELRADPGLWPRAVEELLRYHSVVDWAAGDRMALEDIEVAGQVIRAGDAVVVLNAAVNRDERFFERPDEFDIHRPSNQHLAFGYGVHQCIGHNLARAELQIAYRRLFERLPDLRITADVDDLNAKYDGSIFGLYDLPVAW
ncbi:cytochrome P450 [Micromonospora sp. STR1_7]|uniref:Cytochrome P450 n=1 Tax=Micromonospora parastrephiae TaxID=2806101 RepID=A0ABS1XQ68_9ACTN|nr:cytochrome P450 [Micromonospora parastrephiae]MBM0231405.1 cytochrome P450 [Micromonospora parastrephiae]